MGKITQDDIMGMWKDLDLTPKQLAFVYHYCISGFDEKHAQKEADYSMSTTTLFHNPKIKEAISMFMNAVLSRKKNEILTKAIDVLQKRAFYDPFMFFDENGQPLFNSMKQVPPEWRVVVDGIEEKHWGKEGEVKWVVLKLADRQKALNELTKLLELSKDVIELKGMNNGDQEQAYTFNVNVVDTTTDNPLKKKMEDLLGED